MKDTGISILSLMTMIIPQLIIFSACIYYVVKKITPEGILLCIGALTGLFGIIFHFTFIPYLLHRQIIIKSITDEIRIRSLIRPVSLIGSLTFAVGFFILIHNIIKYKDGDLKKYRINID